MNEPSQGLHLILRQISTVEVLAPQIVLSLHDTCFCCHFQVFEVEFDVVFLAVTGCNEYYISAIWK